jgi:hypothetical protein
MMLRAHVLLPFSPAVSSDEIILNDLERWENEGGASPYLEEIIMSAEKMEKRPYRAAESIMPSRERTEDFESREEVRMGEGAPEGVFERKGRAAEVPFPGFSPGGGHEQESERELEKLGESAASFVRNTFSAVNDLIDELQPTESREEFRGRVQKFREDHPVALTVAAVTAGALTGGALGWYLRGERGPNKAVNNLRQLGRAVPRVINRWVRRAA